MYFVRTKGVHFSELSCISTSLETKPHLQLFLPTLKLYVGPDNSQADPVDFKKALDLLDYVGLSAADAESDLGDIRLHIFARAVLRDDWSKLDVDNPVEAVRETVFFRLAEFCYLQVSFLGLGRIVVMQQHRIIPTTGHGPEGSTPHPRGAVRLQGAQVAEDGRKLQVLDQVRLRAHRPGVGDFGSERGRGGKHAGGLKRVP